MSQYDCLFRFVCVSVNLCICYAYLGMRAYLIGLYIDVSAYFCSFVCPSVCSSSACQSVCLSFCLYWFLCLTWSLVYIWVSVFYISLSVFLYLLLCVFSYNVCLFGLKQAWLRFSRLCSSSICLSVSVCFSLKKSLECSKTNCTYFCLASLL